MIRMEIRKEHIWFTEVPLLRFWRANRTVAHYERATNELTMVEPRFMVGVLKKLKPVLHSPVSIKFW